MLICSSSKISKKRTRYSIQLIKGGVLFAIKTIIFITLSTPLKRLDKPCYCSRFCRWLIVVLLHHFTISFFSIFNSLIHFYSFQNIYEKLTVADLKYIKHQIIVLIAKSTPPLMLLLLLLLAHKGVLEMIKLKT